jgi:hypothetical protein
MIFGDRTAPDTWTDYFGIAPTMYVEKGKPFLLLSGKQSTWGGKSNIWGYSTRGIITDNVLTPHFNHIIAKLKLPRPDLKEFIEENQLTFWFSCYWVNSTHDRVPVVEPHIEDVITQSGVLCLLMNITDGASRA